MLTSTAAHDLKKKEYLNWRKHICRNERKFSDGIHSCCLDRGHEGAHMSATGQQWMRPNFVKMATGSLTPEKVEK